MKNDIKKALTDAMRARDSVRVEAIRLILSALQYEEMNKDSSELGDNEILAVIKREIRKQKEELESAEKAGRSDLMNKIKTEIQTMEQFLPAQLNREQLETVVKNLIYQKENSNIGSVMKALKEGYAGQYDGKLASEVVKALLAEA